jgi:exopolysaccharide biosynthesis operon protein EpsL
MARKKLKHVNTAALIFLGLPMIGAAWSTQARAAVEIPDVRDTLDKAAGVPELIGGTDDPSFDLYAIDQEQFDSNVFRLPSAANVTTTVGPTAVRQDYINSPTAGLDGQWVLGRQIFQLQLRADDNLYVHNSNLNNVSTNDKAAWNWGVGGVLSGQIGADYLRSLLSFVNSDVFTRNTYIQAEYFAAMRFQPGPHWAFYGGILEADVTLADPATRGNDSRRKAVDVGVEFTTNIESSFGVDYRYTDTRYPNSVVLTGQSFAPDYTEDQVRFLGKRVLSEKTSIDLSGGYLKRDYGNSAIGAFSGAVWRGSLGWQPTEKTQLIVSAYRDLQAYLTDATNYYRTTGVSISPVWTASEKITVSLVASRENQTYIGSSPDLLDQSARRDILNAQLVSLVYIPIRALTVNVSFRHEQRDSNQQLRAYDDALASVGLKFAFR